MTNTQYDTLVEKALKVGSFHDQRRHVEEIFKAIDLEGLLAGKHVREALEVIIEGRKDYLPGLTGAQAPHIDLIGHEINTVEWVLRMLEGGDARGWFHSFRWSEIPDLAVITPVTEADRKKVADLLKPKCVCDGAAYAPDQKYPFLVDSTCPIHGKGAEL